MEPFDFLGRYFWLICILIAGINYVFAARREEESGFDVEARRRYLAWFWGLSTIPWIVLGVGQLTGNIRNVWSVFRPRDGNPYVWAFYASILLVYLVSAHWVLFRGGARIAADLRLLRFHGPGVQGAVSEFWIRIIAIAALPFFALWLWMMWKMDVPPM